MGQPVQTSGPVTPDTSSPAYFQSTFKIDALQAAELSKQAIAIDAGRGGGYMAPPVAAAAPAAPSATGLSARAEYDQLIADRAAGKITTAQWHNGGAARERALADLIANGGGSQPAPAAQAPPADPFAQHFAPPASANDYSLPRPPGEMTDAQAAQEQAFKSAAHAEQLPRTLIESIGTSLASAWASLAHETPEQSEARLAGNRTRLTAMWAKSGEGSFDTNLVIVDRELERLCRNPVLRPYLESAAHFMTPLDIDAVYQYAKFRGSRR
jgi:hypothetical protein